MLGLFAVLNFQSVFRQNRSILHPKRIRRDTKTVSMWGVVGVFSLNHVSESPKIASQSIQNTTFRLQTHAERNISSAFFQLSPLAVLLLSAFCFLLSAFCFLPSAFCLP
jgi:hypothetical protein